MASEGDPDSDDFFGNQADNERSEKENRQREWDALRRLHYNAGLREGGSAAHDANLQQGFDDGFVAGARAVAQTAFVYVYCPYNRSINSVSQNADYPQAEN